MKTKNVGAILPEVVNAEYNYINIDCRFKYNLKNTDSTVFEIETAVASVISEYSDNELAKFDGVLRYSKLLSAVDATDVGIENSIIYLTMYKKIKPNPLATVDYVTTFPTEIYKSSESDENIVFSSTFFIDGLLSEIKDEPMLNGTKDRRLYIVDSLTGIKISKYSDIGYADVSEGKIYINSIKFDTSNELDIFIRPDAFDIAPKFNQILTISSNDIKVKGYIDTIAAYDLAGISSYVSFTADGG